MDVGQIVKKAKKGNKEALLQLVMNQKDEYYRLAYTYMENQHDAMDAMEEMILRLYENIGQLKKEDAFYSWSKTILVNSCKSLLRKRKKLVLVEDFNQYIEADIPDPYLHSEQQIDIQQLLMKVNPHQAETIKLKYFHDLDYETIAQITNVSVGTVKSRIFEGLKKLRRFSGGGKDE
ncbi:RNA polymerase sigma factor [Anaerobacillus sp. CMMVII]|uniref:RNA polymerase sigma factor n=1 Tax=Anaerobacillus sp. CMMVII TaxID=2755588 RepID=UPI0021B75B82|nr:RNA polymerase sigma factor [Anaerobacillus sp. CMMVII]MCT8136688.1 RNA polymerase sigma factor [Anaerobacillus sp. CMMVII]